jgi:hypothetical protein
MELGEFSASEGSGRVIVSMWVAGVEVRCLVFGRETAGVDGEKPCRWQVGTRCCRVRRSGEL